MSTDPIRELTPALDGWVEIDELLDDLARLARAEISSRDFHVALLERAVRGLAADGGAVWMRGSKGVWEPDCQLSLPESFRRAAMVDADAHTQLLSAVAQSGEARVTPPRLVSGGEDQAANSTSALLVLSPFAVDSDAVGVVEIVHAAPVPLGKQHEQVRILSAMCELAADFHRQRELGALRDREALWRQFEQFAREVHGNLDVTSTAYAIANEGRRLIGCDRVSVGSYDDRRGRLLAVSGVDRVDPRASLVAAWETLAAAVARMHEPVWHGAASSALAPEIEAALHGYLEHSPARSLAVVPLQGPVAADSSGAARPAIGVLLVERFDSDAMDDLFRQRVEAVARHGGLALNNAQTYCRIPLLPVWRAWEKSAWLVRARQLPKTVAVLACLAVLIAGLFVIPADFDVESPGEMQPRHRRDVFAGTDGVVGEVRVRHAAPVAADDVLVVLRKPQLELELTRVLGEVQTATKRLRAVQVAGASAGTPDKVNQAAGEEEEIKQLLVSLAEQEKILKAEREELTVRSPLDGVVLTWNVAELLEERPVARGQLLLAVAAKDDDWELKLKLPDNQAGHVLAAQQEFGPQLDVTYILATDPGTRYRGQVKELALATESDKATGATVPLSVIPGDTPAGVRPGATVVAKIHCGRRSLGYVWLHGVWEAIESRVLF